MTSESISNKNKTDNSYTRWQENANKRSSVDTVTNSSKCVEKCCSWGIFQPTVDKKIDKKINEHCCIPTFKLAVEHVDICHQAGAALTSTFSPLSMLLFNAYIAAAMGLNQDSQGHDWGIVISASIGSILTFFALYWLMYDNKYQYENLKWALTFVGPPVILLGFEVIANKVWLEHEDSMVESNRKAERAWFYFIAFFLGGLSAAPHVCSCKKYRENIDANANKIDTNTNKIDTNTNTIDTNTNTIVQLTTRAYKTQPFSNSTTYHLVFDEPVLSNNSNNKMELEEMDDKEEVKKNDVAHKLNSTAPKPNTIKVNKSEFNKMVAQIVEKKITTEMSKQKKLYEGKLQAQDKRYDKLNQDLADTEKKLKELTAANKQVKKELYDTKKELNTKIDEAINVFEEDKKK